MGLDPDQEYTADEIWEVAKDLSFVVQNNITKEQLIQFLGAGPATKLDDDDLGFLSKIADELQGAARRGRPGQQARGRAVRQGRIHALALLPVRGAGGGTRCLGRSRGSEGGID